MASSVTQLLFLNPDLPEDFLGVLPKECDRCSVEMVISETLTSLRCSNPRCASKYKIRIKSICHDLGIKGFGESAIDSFLDTYEPTSPMNIFDLTEDMPVGEGVGEAKSADIISQLIDIKENRTFLLWEVVRLLHMPGIQTSAQKVFANQQGIDEAYSEIYNGGVEYVHEKLFGEVVDSVGIKSIQVYTTLMEMEEDVKEAVQYFNIASTVDAPELTVVVSDQVGGRFSTKNEFYNFCKENFSGRFHFNFASSVSRKSTECLIWAGSDGSDARYTSKVQKVEGYNEKYNAGIPILTGEQFVEFLESGRDIDELYEYSLEVNSMAMEEVFFEDPSEDIGML